MKKNKINTKNTDMLLPKAYRPLSPWNYFWRSVLYSIPVIGWIFLLAHAIAGKSRHGRSFARFHLLTVIVAAIVLAAVLLSQLDLAEIKKSFKK